MTRASLAAFAAGSAFLVAAAGAAGNDGTIQRQDAKATSNARNMVSYVEACWTDSEDYRNCRTAKELGDTGLPIGRHRGQVRVVRAGRTTFRIGSWSRSGHHFYVTKTRSGALKRTCTGATTQICVNGRW